MRASSIWRAPVSCFAPSCPHKRTNRQRFFTLQTVRVGVVDVVVAEVASRVAPVLFRFILPLSSSRACIFPPFTTLLSITKTRRAGCLHRLSVLLLPCCRACSFIVLSLSKLSFFYNLLSFCSLHGYCRKKRGKIRLPSQFVVLFLLMLFQNSHCKPGKSRLHADAAMSKARQTPATQGGNSNVKRIFCHAQQPSTGRSAGL